MNYNNWQQRHKQAYQTARQKPISTYTSEDIKARAWNNLQRWCSAEELQKLSELAQRYQRGEVRA